MSNLIIPKRWGKEEIIINNELYCYKKLYISRDCGTSVHSHRIKDESFVVEKGTAEITVKTELGDKKFILKEEEKMRIFPNVKHKIWAIDSDLVLIEISTNDDPCDSFRVEEIHGTESKSTIQCRDI